MAINVKLPSFRTDPVFKQSQKELFKVGQDLVRGTPNRYFAPIGQYGGAEFEDFLSSVLSDVRTSVDEDVIARGVSRGGLAAAATAKSISKVSPALRYQDLLRGLEGRQSLLRTGVDTLGGTASRGLEFGTSRNRFELGVSGLDINQQRINEEIRLREDEIKAQKKANRNKMISSIISSGIGAVGSFATARMLKKFLPLGSASKGLDIGKYSQGSILGDLSIIN